MKKHFCPDWDYMAIDEHSPEFEACGCEQYNRKVDKELGAGHKIDMDQR